MIEYTFYDILYDFETFFYLYHCKCKNIIFRALLSNIFFHFTCAAYHIYDFVAGNIFFTYSDMNRNLYLAKNVG